MSKQLRELIQNEADLFESTQTALELETALRKTREHSGGISLQEVSDIIKEALSEEEIEVIINNLQ